tara:strand:- start:44 stop:1135 length:1092 start_codon:yes stop_codon:yes gene_type:complete
MLSLYSWGYNTNGQLGVNNKTNYSSPVQVGSNTTWAKMGGFGTEGSSASIKNDGTLWTWGKGAYGATGQNTENDFSSPKQVPGTTWNEVAGQQQGMTATKTDGTLWAWGQNNDGQLGQNENGNPTNRSSPVQVGSDTDWSKPVDSRSKSGGATKTDGTLWTWGENSNGILGHNNKTDYSSPVQVGSETTWADVSIGRSASLASKTDGTLWAWGDNTQGELAQNHRDERSSPVQIPGSTWGTGAGSVASSDDWAGALKTDGTLWFWGRNEYGQFGQNTVDDRYSSPVQVPGTTWRSVFLGHKSTFATKTDGTLWSWGYGKRSNSAMLGLNSTTFYSSPVQVGSETNWHSNLGGSYFTTLGMRMN